MIKCSHPKLNNPRILPKETNLHAEKLITCVKVYELVRNIMIYSFLFLLMVISGGIQVKKPEV